MRPRKVILLHAATQAMYDARKYQLDVWGYAPFSMTEAIPREARTIVTDCIIDAEQFAEMRRDWPGVPIVCIVPKLYAGNTLPLVNLECVVLFEGDHNAQLRHVLKLTTRAKRGPKPKGYRITPAQSGQIARVM